MNEEKVTVAGCLTGSKEFLQRKVDKNVFALLKPRMPGEILAFTDLRVFIVVYSRRIAVFLICYIDSFDCLDG